MADKKTYALNQVTSATSSKNALSFAIDMAKNIMSTCTVVQVQKVTTKGDVAPIGNVDVLPLVDLVDGIARTSKHINVHNLSYVRVVGGTKAIIMDPVVNDIGVAVFADRDISAVKKSKKQSPPGSGRRFNMADGIYISSIIADKPTSYVQFHDDGSITISPNGGTSYILLDKSSGDITIKGTHVYINPV